MASPRFNLNSRTNSDNKSLIMLVYRYPNGLLRFSTGKLIRPKYWNTKLNKAKETSQYPYKELNAFLKKLGFEAERILNDYQSRSEHITNLKFKNELNIFLGKAAREKTDLISFFGPFIESRKIKGNTDDNIKEFELLKIRLTEFRKELPYHSIDQEFYSKFIKFLTDKPYAINTIGKFIRRFITVLNAATEKGYNKNMLYKGFKAPKEDVDKVYINEIGLANIEKRKFELKSDLDIARDWLLVLCNTGFRIGDSAKLTSDHIKSYKGVNIIEYLDVSKGGSSVAIPISDQLQRIIDKWDGFPKAITEKALNIAIKNVCRFARLNEEVEIKGKFVRFYTQVTTHTGRRSFISNKLLNGYTVYEVSKMTGQDVNTITRSYDHILSVDSVVKSFKERTLKSNGALRAV